MMKIVVRVLLLLFFLPVTVEGHRVFRSFVNADMCEPAVQPFSNSCKSPFRSDLFAFNGNFGANYKTVEALRSNKVGVTKTYGIKEGVASSSYKVVGERVSTEERCAGTVLGVGDGVRCKMSGWGAENQNLASPGMGIPERVMIKNPFTGTEEEIFDDVVTGRRGPQKIGKEDEGQLVTPDYRPPVGDSLLPLMVMIFAFLIVKVKKNS